MGNSLEKKTKGKPYNTENYQQTGLRFLFVVDSVTTFNQMPDITHRNKR